MALSIYDIFAKKFYFWLPETKKRKKNTLNCLHKAKNYTNVKNVNESKPTRSLNRR